MGQNYIIDWGIFYYQLGQVLLQNWGNFALLQIGASVITKLGELRFITNWGRLIFANQGSYYKLGQPLLQTGANFITN